jgi:RNA polymerase sigma-70 factor (ECF subfamily)
MIGEPGAAEDLVQEAILKAFRASDRFELGTNFRAWLFTILTNLCINEYRKRARTPLVADFADREPTGPEEIPYVSVEDVERLGDQLGDAARAALRKVSPELRIVFLLSTFEEMSYKEISGILELPIGTVMSRLFRARAILRRELTEFAREQGAFASYHRALFEAYFGEGRDIGDEAVLAELGAACGLDPDALRQSLEEHDREVREFKDMPASSNRLP